TPPSSCPADPAGRRVPPVARPPRRGLGHHGGVLFAEVVATTDAVAATRSRSAKVAALADLLARLAPEEVPVVVSILGGTPRQGRIGIGWRTLAGLEVPPATEATLAIAEIDTALDRLAALRGPGSQAARTAAL